MITDKLALDVFLFIIILVLLIILAFTTLRTIKNLLNKSIIVYNTCLSVGLS